MEVLLYLSPPLSSTQSYVPVSNVSFGLFPEIRSKSGSHMTSTLMAFKAKQMQNSPNKLKPFFGGSLGFVETSTGWTPHSELPLGK